MRDVVVVGGGVIGLSVALALADIGHSVDLWERRESPGLEQSTHNSGVIHAGFNAVPGSLRARLNVEGNRLLYEQAQRWGVPTRRGGTLVVANDDAGARRLDELLARGSANGVPGLERLGPEEVSRYEPKLGPCVAALRAPSGGIVDPHALVQALERECRRSGVRIAYRRELRRARRRLDAWQLTAVSGEEQEARLVVNCAGVGSAKVAALLGASDYRIFPCVGEYARIHGPKREWIRSMVYGLPPSGHPGIGVHLTRTTAGELILGPTATYISDEVAPDPPLTPLEEFAREAGGYLPGVEMADLERYPSGVRAKPVPPGTRDPFQDFVIREDPVGSGAIQLVGIESPGLTASIAIGRFVAREIVPPRFGRG